MKKSVLICCIVALISSTAYAADIDASVSFKNVHVDVTNTNGAEIPTIQLLNKQKTRVLYAEEGVFDGNKYVFDDFSFPENEATGEYIIRIGENGKITEKTIRYSSFSDIVKALKMLENKEASAYEILIPSAEVFGTTKADMEGLGGKWINRLENEISEIDIDTSSDDAVKKSYSEVVAAVKKIISYANLTSSSDLGRIEDAIKAIGGLDLKYLDNLTDKTKISQYFAPQNLNALTIGYEEISKAFDASVLMAVINSSDWGTGRDTLRYYADKGILSISSAYLNAGADVYKELKNRNLKKYTDIPNVLAEIYSSSNKNTGGGSSGGGGGGGSKSNMNTMMPTPKDENNVQPSKSRFKDMTGYDWAVDAVESLYETGVVNGRSEDTYAPQDNITRAEFVKMIITAFNLTDENAYAEFTDVPDDSWSYKYIASAKKSGIVSGMSDDYFGASEEISRQDMAVIVARVMDMMNISVNGNAISFTDSDEISSYAKESVERLSAAGIINGMGDGTYCPLNKVTRAQSAKVIYEIMQRKGQ